jgi:hypothetical protein
MYACMHVCIWVIESTSVYVCLYDVLSVYYTLLRLSRMRVSLFLCSSLCLSVRSQTRLWKQKFFVFLRFLTVVFLTSNKDTVCE